MSLQKQPGKAVAPYLPWFVLAAILFACLSVLAHLDDRFGYDVYVIDMPVPALVSLLVAAGLVFLLLPRLIHSTERAGRANPIYVFTWIIVAGLAMRLVFIGTQPILEDDYNRYLLDGAVTAQGISPYRFSPEEIYDRGTGDAKLERLAEDAGPILERINYPGLTSVYPPVAQAAFALAHLIKPWSLETWRLVLLACDLTLCALILLLLQTIARPATWIALYWWNPVVIKELHNSAHMDLLVMLAVAAALLLAVRAKPYASALLMAVGIGAKLWPALLFPTLLRPWLADRKVLFVAAAITGLVAASLLAPIVLAGLGKNSGFVAYGSRWQANDALFRAIEAFFLWAGGLLGWDPSIGKLAARGFVGAILCGVVLLINRAAPSGPRETCYRAFLTIGALLLLSPTQCPWYYGWLAILLPLFPMRGFLVLTATLPLYYIYFHLAARDMAEWFRYGVVVAIWLPAWALLIADRFRDPIGWDTADYDKLEGNSVPGGPK